MSSVSLASISLKPKDGHDRARAILEWDKHDGYVVGISVPDGEPDITRILARDTFARIPEALRALADLVEEWDSRRLRSL